MAVIAMLIGSILGFIGAVVGWVFLDISLMQAFGLYVGTALSFGLLGATAMMGRNSAQDHAMASGALHG
jgi:hypothetical protein